jgi:hypothetical protein
MAKKTGSVQLTSIDELKTAKKAPGRKRSAAVVTRIDGYAFDSKAEANRYCELKLLEQAGEIQTLMVHVRYLLQSGHTNANNTRFPAQTWTADFQYIEGGRLVVEDVKAGQDTTASQRARALFEERWPDVLFVNETKK